MYHLATMAAAASLSSPLLEGAAIMLLRHAMSFEGEGGPLVSGKAFIFGVTRTNNCPNYFGHDTWQRLNGTPKVFSIVSLPE